MASSAPTALSGWVAAQDDLIQSVDSGSLQVLTDTELVALLREVEVARNRQAVVDHQLIAELEARNVPSRMASSTTASFLISTLRLSPGEAHRRVRAAAACAPRRSFVGQDLDPVRPTLAAAQRAGTASPEQVDLIVRGLAPYDRAGFDPADVEAGERLLAGFTAEFAPTELRGLVDKVVSAIDPDGSRPDDELNADRRHFTMRTTKDGAYTGTFRLTASAGAKLAAILAPLTRPRLTLTGVEGAATVPDPRSLPQRRHDALEDMCDRLLRSDTLPASGGTPATVIVNIDLDDLLSRTGTGKTSDGTPFTVAQLLELADQAEIIPTVLNSAGAVLDLGRSKRIATDAQTLALYARDGGCSFPGCAHPPDYCERHHIIAWIDGGETNLDNLTLLCRYHHHNFAQRGWDCHINADRLPTWTPPAWIDPGRRPLTNTRITAATLARRAQDALVLIS